MLKWSVYFHDIQSVLGSLELVAEARHRDRYRKDVERVGFDPNLILEMQNFDKVPIGLAEQENPYPTVMSYNGSLGCVENRATEFYRILLGMLKEADQTSLLRPVNFRIGLMIFSKSGPTANSAILLPRGG